MTSDLVLAQAKDLGRGETVAGHRAARALDANQGFVGSRPGGDEDGVDFGAQAFDRACAHVALESEHVDAFAGLPAAARLGFGLHLLLARLGERLALLLVEQDPVHGVAHVVVALGERADLNLLVLRLAGAGETRDEQRQSSDRRDDDDRLEEKGGDVEPEGHKRVRSR